MSRNFLELRLGQSLTLTPALQQSIKLLQLSALDLEAEIARALAENPLLEQEGEGLQTPAAAAIAHPSDGPVYEGDAKEQAQAEADFASDERYDDSRGAEPDRIEFSSEPRASRDDDFPDRPEPARESNLREHLLSQLGTTRLSAKDAALVELLIEELNEDGFLASPLDEIASWMKPELGLEAEDFNAPLLMLQSFDPPGVGARDLAECLALQVQFAEVDRFPEFLDVRIRTLARALCQQHLAVLATGNMIKLRELLVCEPEELRCVHAVILRLNPRPGSAWNKPAADFAVPDVIVRKTRKGWVASLNESIMPKLRVSEVIVQHQQSFFSKGWAAVRPLTLKDVAGELGMHESTISRATTQKFMVTPFGTVELKRFFSTGLATEGAEATSSTAVQTRIQVLINQEDRSRPLSDSQLAKLLDQDGITIARRTVAKYRELLRIPTAPLRKSQAGAG